MLCMWEAGYKRLHWGIIKCWCLKPFSVSVACLRQLCNTTISSGGTCSSHLWWSLTSHLQTCCSSSEPWSLKQLIFLIKIRILSAFFFHVQYLYCSVALTGFCIANFQHMKHNKAVAVCASNNSYAISMSWGYPSVYWSMPFTWDLPKIRTCCSKNLVTECYSEHEITALAWTSHWLLVSSEAEKNDLQGWENVFRSELTNLQCLYYVLQSEGS